MQVVTRITLSGPQRRRRGVPARGRKARQATANVEVILAGGAINSPQLLQLSGIGPAETPAQVRYRRRRGPSRGGQQLTGTLQWPTGLSGPHEQVTLNDVLASPVRSVMEGLRYVTRRKGFLTMGSSQAAGFFRSNPSLASPDMHLGLTLFSTDRAGDPLHPFSGFSIIVRLLRPH